jgi:NADPH-dependent 2,4-dienoyl-CoA reductase/sulfur reductase-like enzyme
MTPGRVLIVGAGIAGSRCAETLRSAGFEGAVLLVGDESHPPYERPALSKEFLAGRRDDLCLRPATFWGDKGIELLLGTRVHRVDTAARIAETEAGPLAWDAVVLATGARPRRLAPFDGRSGVHLLRTIADAESLRAAIVPGHRLAIVGAGFVGAEVASTARELGAEVTILEALSAPLVRVLGPEVGRLLADRYREHGVDLRLGAQVERLVEGPDGALRGVALADGSEVRCDALLVAVGATPAGELAGGDAIRTDECGRTDVPGVYACGDAAASWRPSLGGHVRMEHWTSAAAQGAAVARAIVGDPEPYDDVPYFWSDQFGLRLQHVGHPDGWARVALEGEPGSFAARYHTEDGRLVAALLVNRRAEVGAVRRELAELRPAA